MSCSRIDYRSNSSGWILPAPADVATELSSEALFRGLDGRFAPRFVLNTDFDGDCGDWDEGGRAERAAPVVAIPPRRGCRCSRARLG